MKKLNPKDKNTIGYMLYPDSNNPIMISLKKEESSLTIDQISLNGSETQTIVVEFDDLLEVLAELSIDLVS